MTRWQRAAQAIDLPTRSRVLDLGCAFGFGTRLLVPKYTTFGHDLDERYIERARGTVRGATFTTGSASDIPYSDRHFDGVLLLDVLEHVPDEQAVVSEIRRILRPGGRLVVSVPNRGILQRFDSLNVYSRLQRPGWPPPTDDPSWPLVQQHRHYSLTDLEALLGDGFVVRSVQYTGVGVAEFVNLVLLVLLRGLLRLSRLYVLAQFPYFALYMAEDAIPTGPWGYHMMVVLDRV